MSDKKTILITGAGAGIGRACAEHFAAKGWFVGVYDVDQQGVTEVLGQIGDGQGKGGLLDVTDANAWKVTLDDFVAAAGRLDVLVNNAGIAESGEFQEIPAGMHSAIVDVNVKGVMYGCQAVFPYLKESKGSVINMASASAIYGQPELASYSSTKFAVRGLTEALDLEWEKYGVRVLDIWPLFVQTKMVEGLDIKSMKSMGIKLTPKDVAVTIDKALAHSGHPRKIHWPVGVQARMFAPMVNLLPAAVARLVNRQITSSHK